MIDMDTIEFKKEYIDIIDLLKSTIALGIYRGNEVWTEIEKLINRVSDCTLILIDLRQVIWLNTAFCQPAFGPIFESLKNHKWSRKYVMFQMYDFHKPGFFQGVLKYFEIDVPRKESESEFSSANMYAKLIVGDKDSINFFGNMDRNEQTILNVVNNLKQTIAKQVVDKSGLSEEIVVDTLRSLARDKYFIVEHIVDKSDKKKKYNYYSFYNYFRKG